MTTITTTYRVRDDYLGDTETFNTYDDAMEYCQQSEIIYYHKALAYLMENDASLVESLSLAEDFGLTPSNLNSETLATIHYQDALMQTITEEEK